MPTQPPIQTTEVTPATPQDIDRAMDALELAAASAERGMLVGVLPPAPREGFRAAARLDVARVRERLDRVVMGQDPEVGLDALLETGALDALFPEVHAMVGFGDGEWRHKDVWKHTKQVVRQAVPRLEVRWASLFHDIGKVKTRSISPEGKVHFLGHAEVGTRMFDKLERRLRAAASRRRVHHGRRTPTSVAAATASSIQELGLDDVDLRISAHMEQVGIGTPARWAA